MIHPSAVIHPDAQLAEDVEVGAFSVIGPHVRMGSGCRIASHVVIEGHTTLGCDNRVFQFASLGAEPQDKKYAGEPTELIIGDRNVIREYCTFNVGTMQDKAKTVLGNDNWIMAYVHLAHDCVIGDSTIFANGATLAGHVTIHDYAILGGFTLVHQFCEVGEYAFTAMGTAVGKDVPPYTMTAGSPAIPRGINQEGLRRRGFSAESMQHIKDAYRLIYRQQLLLSDALVQIEAEMGQYPEIRLLLDFCHRSQRGLIR